MRLDSCLKYFSRFGPFEKAYKKIKYPGLRLANGVNFSLCGSFKYGADCGLGEGTNIIVSEGSELVLGEDCFVGRYVELGATGRMSIGSHTSIQDRCIFVGDVTVGRYCLISLNVMLGSGRHYFELMPSWLIRDQDNFSMHQKDLLPARSSPVVIEDDCWLGINTVVMPGVTVGKGAVVGAGAVVVRDVEPYTVVAGAPAREVNKRLHFAPPRRITFSSERDWPYFYSGFEMSQAEMQESSTLGGIAAREEFVLCLDASTGTSVRVVAKSIQSSECTITIGAQCREVSSEFREMSFESLDATCRIAAKVRPTTAMIIVREAWIQ
jgi:acetyltransferase-like isoleucine patch superfamily enzyme